MTPEAMIQAFCNAIATAEGFYVDGSVPQRAKNPGDLTDDGDVGNGVIETYGPAGAKITIYSSVEAGWAALTKKVSRMLNGASTVYRLDMTISEVGVKWSGTVNWGVNVAEKLGLTPQSTLADYVSQLPENPLDADNSTQV